MFKSDRQRRQTDESSSAAALTKLEALGLPLKKGTVRRAIRLVDIVTQEASAGSEADYNLVLMTAVLLVERMSKALGCDHQAILDKIAGMFAAREHFAAAAKRVN